MVMWAIPPLKWCDFCQDVNGVRAASFHGRELYFPSSLVALDCLISTVQKRKGNLFIGGSPAPDFEFSLSLQNHSIADQTGQFDICSSRLNNPQNEEKNWYRCFSIHIWSPENIRISRCQYLSDLEREVQQSGRACRVDRQRWVYWLKGFDLMHLC